MKTFDGTVIFLDRSDINTDEIIPARYLTEVSKEALAPHLFEDLRLDGFQERRDPKQNGAVLTRANFGCGSSREHAVWALEMNRIHLVVAESFARIFRQNMFNCGMLAVELPPPAIDSLFDTFREQETQLAADLEKRRITFTAENAKKTVTFRIAAFDLALVKAGGWLEFAEANY
jgi:3-isopropylmalate/(R)-2-methylmalate dehydratase small subunit